MTLDELPDAFASARAAASAAAQFAVDETPPRTCRYCGRFWSYHNASNNDGHATCLITDDFRRAFVELWHRSPATSMQALVAVCGVSKGTINAWIYGRSARLQEKSQPKSQPNVIADDKLVDHDRGRSKA